MTVSDRYVEAGGEYHWGRHVDSVGYEGRVGVIRWSAASNVVMVFYFLVDRLLVSVDGSSPQTVVVSKGLGRLYCAHKTQQDRAAGVVRP